MRRRPIRLESLEARLVLDSTVVFNELMYHPAGDAVAQLEWIELHNQMAIDMDLSHWSLAGGVDFEFADGTFLPGGGYLVVAGDPAALEAAGVYADALGPFTGRLANGGDIVELRDRNDRLMDQIEYTDGGNWPTAPDGTGASLAKVDRNSTSPQPGNWASSVRIGGTPGRRNFGAGDAPASPAVSGLVFSEVASSAGSPFWIELVNDGAGPLDAGGFRVTSSSGNEYVLPPQSLTAGDRLVLNDAALGFQPGLGDIVRLVTPDGSEVRDVVRVTEGVQARRAADERQWLTPSTSTPGSDNVFSLHDNIVINEIMYHHRAQPPVPGRDGEFGPATTILPFDAEWRFDQSGDDLGVAWRETSFDDSSWDSGDGLFYVENASLPAPKTTLLTIGVVTYYFRTTFAVDDPGDVAVQIQHIIDDGAVFYVNGHEFLRFNQDGPVAFDTPASGSVGDAVLSGIEVIPAQYLVPGENVLAVEVHQRTANSSDVVFGARLATAELVTPPQPARPFAEIDDEWIELLNRGTATVDLGGWRLDEAVGFTFPADTLLPPGELLLIANDAAAIGAKYPTARIVGSYSGSLNNSDERIVLLDDVGNPADEVHYYDGGRWPEYADGGGASLELRDPWADNSSPEAWAAGDEGSKSTWRTYTYRGIAQSSGVGPDGQWQEFVMGLNDSGEVLLDDISVIEDPGGAPRQLIQNGTFDAGNAQKWRNIGNHSHSEVVPDPDDPSNPVLRLVATGETEHMSNHAETTLKFNNSVVSIVNGREYEISYRARWIGGSSQLNTRLYFNRLPRTTLIDQPELHGTPGAPNSRRETNIGPTYTDFQHDPVVPAALQAVTVSVRASDPQAVGSMTLWYTTAGGDWTSTAMTLGSDGLYRGTIPGQAASTIVQFYVEGADSSAQPATSTFPARGRDSRALYKVNDNQAATNGLHNMRLILTAADAGVLHATTNLMSNDWLGGTVIYDESEVFYDVGIRLKGSEHSRTTTPRLGFSVQFHSEQLFRGVHRTVAIDRSESVGFGQREMLIHAAMNHAGGLPTKYNDLIKVITPQSAHTGSAELQLARYGDEFLDSQYENGGDGDLYEYELVYQLNSTVGGDPEGLKIPNPDSVVGTSIRDLGDDKENYRWNFLIKNNRTRDNYSELIDFTKAMGAGREFLNVIAEYIDVDQWLRGFAISMLSGAGDAYGGDGSQHNLMLYVRPSDGRVLFMPHDLDAFYDPNRPLVPNGDLQKLIAAPANARAYYGHVHDIISTSYNNTYMSHWATEFGQLLPGQPFPSHLSFINSRSNSILSQVRSRVAPIDFAITTPDGLVVNEPTATIAGNGWVNVREIRLAGSDRPLTLSWTDLDSWEAVVPVSRGEQTLTFEAYDFQGNLIDTAQIAVESTFSERPLEDFLRITEIHYHPADGPPGGPYEDANYEFIELANTGGAPLDLANARFIAGISFDFSTSAIATLAPGAHLVLVQHREAFESRYGLNVPIAGVYGGRLDNAGEHLRLEDVFGATILDFTYDDAWYPATDGPGRSLVIVDAGAATEAWNTAEGWRASLAVHGSPGRADLRLGDTDGDGDVNLDDLNNVRNFFGGNGGGDADHDGDVDLDDLNAVRNYFGTSAAPLATTWKLPPRDSVRARRPIEDAFALEAWDRALLDFSDAPLATRRAVQRGRLGNAR